MLRLPISEYLESQKLKFEFLKQFTAAPRYVSMKKSHPDIPYLMANRTVTSEILAYVWMALETRQNALVCGPKDSLNSSVLSCIMPLISSVEDVVMIENSINQVKESGMRNIIAIYDDKNTKAAHVNEAIKLRPDRIVCDKIEGQEAQELFHSGNINIPFISTMECEGDATRALEALISKPFSVNLRYISALDFIISTSCSGKQCSISGIYELRWLSKAETDTGISIADKDMVQINRIEDFTAQDISNSKMANEYYRTFFVPPDEAAKEFRRRSRLIESAFGQGQGVEEAINSYKGW